MQFPLWVPLDRLASMPPGHWSGLRALSHSTDPRPPLQGRQGHHSRGGGWIRPSAGFVVSLSLLGRIKHPAFPDRYHEEVETTMGSSVPPAHSARPPCSAPQDA